VNRDPRFHALDALRAGALLLGIALHSTLSFWPGMRELDWPISDDSTSDVPAAFFFVVHIFRMSVFYAIAGFFAHALLVRLGPWGFVKNRLRRIALPFAVAMVVVMPMLLLPFLWGQKQLGISGPPHIRPPIPDPHLPPWGHLWFLYLLLVLYALWMSARLLVHAVDRRGAWPARADRAFRALVVLRVGPLVWAAPTAAALYFTPWWSMWQGIPPPIMGFVPNVPALLAFGMAFAFGWLLHRQPALLEVLGRDWLVNLAAAAAASVVALVLIGATPKLDVHELPMAQRLAYAASYDLATWCWMFALIGAAHRFLSAPDPRWRFLADASFFVYLVHLPVVYALQAWMMRWPLHWSLKYALVLSMTLVVTLGLYQALVRNTFVGVFLNGRRHPPPSLSAGTRTSPG
jgi:peptidoglycan/LPS O-acetylase OafA/YrhL